MKYLFNEKTSGESLGKIFKALIAPWRKLSGRIAWLRSCLQSRKSENKAKVGSGSSGAATTQTSCPGKDFWNHALCGLLCVPADLTTASPNGQTNNLHFLGFGCLIIIWTQITALSSLSFIYKTQMTQTKPYASFSL